LLPRFKKVVEARVEELLEARVEAVVERRLAHTLEEFDEGKRSFPRGWGGLL